MDDRRLLDAAVRQQRYWDVIYHSRRLMQIDLHDRDADTSLVNIPGQQLVYSDAGSGQIRPNPLLAPMDQYSRADFIRSAQLVERNRGEILFRVGDAGDTMFVILRGDLAVSFDPDPQALSPGDAPAIRIGVGEIVGELAFALHRRRTATLQCLTPTTLLSFSPEAVEAVADNSPSQTAIRQALSRFVKARVLEYLCNNANYLIGGDRSGPLSGLAEPWMSLIDNTTLLYYPGRRSLASQDRELRRPGLYVLVSGELGETSLSEHLLDGTKLPVMHADFPGAAIRGSRSYDVALDALIVRIGPEAFCNPALSEERFRDLLEAVRSAVAGQEQSAASG
jgi:hypothetical protein